MDPRVKPVGDIECRPLFNMVVDLNPKLNFGAGPAGARVLYGSAGGSFSGSRLHGDVLPGGGDWALFRADGAMTLDVRLSLRCSDGALIHMTYGGRWITPAAVLPEMTDPALRTSVDPSRYYFRTSPLFETGSPEYSWLNDIVCVGKGYLVEGGVAYTIFEVL